MGEYRAFYKNTDTNTVIETFSNEDKDKVMNWIMLKFYTDLGNGGMAAEKSDGSIGSLWRCADEVYDAISSGLHEYYHDREFWITGPESPYVLDESIGDIHIVKNNLSKYELMLALIKWALKIDGHDGAIAGVISVIPWDDSIEKIITYDSISKELDEVIGSSIKVDVNKYLIGCKDEDKIVKEWACSSTERIFNWYESLIDKVNRMISMRTNKIIK